MLTFAPVMSFSSFKGKARVTACTMCITNATTQIQTASCSQDVTVHEQKLSANQLLGSLSLWQRPHITFR